MFHLRDSLANGMVKSNPFYHISLITVQKFKMLFSVWYQLLGFLPGPKDLQKAKNSYEYLSFALVLEDVHLQFAKTKQIASF